MKIIKWIFWIVGVVLVFLLGKKVVDTVQKNAEEDAATEQNENNTDMINNAINTVGDVFGKSTLKTGDDKTANA